MEVDQFNWHRDGPKPSLTARILYDDETLYLHFHVEDHRISSQVTELNGPTYLDSSVELFADPNPNEDSRYFNFEANCCGYFKLAWQEEDWQERDIGRDLVSMRVAEQIRVETSVEGSTREPRDDDTGWWLAAAIPFSVLRSLTGVDVGPTPVLSGEETCIGVVFPPMNKKRRGIPCRQRNRRTIHRSISVDSDSIDGCIFMRFPFGTMSATQLTNSVHGPSTYGYFSITS
ncbi:carbohydrate-binding family 9-like protein [Haladaptatus pallidirubidus]|uniref:carbohydrate-binding family 9-like protein n=1 Tax=Haladaptatus pallidirubidus TaxID=1008152 RepID=UPI0035EF058B